jgi:alcohol dehydrogenase (cytochrome c)
VNQFARFIGIAVTGTMFVATPRAEAQAAPAVSYTTEQALAGEATYRASCAACHGPDLRGEAGPALAGPDFLAQWGRPDRSVDDLYFLLRTTMPPGGAGRLTANQQLGLLAYLLRRNGFAPGTDPLTADPTQLRSIVFGGARPIPSSAAPEFVAGPGGTVPSGSGPSQAELDGAGHNARDWLYSTHDYSGQRYALQTQINRTTVRQLRVACAYQLGTTENFQADPIVYRGVMYLTTMHLTVAIDAATCRPIWKHVWQTQDRDVWPANRGVAIQDGRVVRATSDGYLVALDAAKGTLLWARHVASADKGETFTVSPLIYHDLILIGPAGSENVARGWVGAFKVEDGSPVWRFNLVPQPGERGSETWQTLPGMPNGGGGVWTAMTLDVGRGLLHLAASNPSPDFPQRFRTGQNLFTNSMVALDARTGSLAWYAHPAETDAHDWDLTQAGPLFSSRTGAQPRDLMALVGKEGVLRVYDRSTHAMLHQTPVTTIENADAPVTTAGTHACPGVWGGVEWHGPAYNPATNLLYTPVVDWCGTFTASDSVRYIPGKSFLGGQYTRDSTSQGWLTAVDASTGGVRWRYRSPRPMVAAVTTTAGGLVFTGELTGDFLAFDAASGTELFRLNTGGPIGGGVVSYAVKGKQYVAVMTGKPSRFWINEHPGSATAFVLTLP